MRRPLSPKDAAGADRLLGEAAAQMAAGRPDLAAPLYERAARAAPEDFRARLSLATIHLGRGRPDLAAPQLRAVVRIRPDLYEAWHNLGAACQALEIWAEAAGAYEAALALRPQAVESRRNLAVALTILGRTNEAERHHRHLAAHPEIRAWALTRLALMAPGAVTDAELAEIRQALADPGSDLDSRIGLQFALGEVLERRGENEAAFAAFGEGNRLKRQTFAARPGSDPTAVLAAHVRAARHVASIYPAEVFARRQGQAQGLATSAAIFIVGMPRSGSTLIEQILSSHPDVAALGETAALPALLEDGAAAPRAGREALREVGRRYLGAVRARGWRGAGRFVDKTLENYLHVGAIALMFPNAVILHAVRDPVDTCLSCYRQLFAAGAETLYDLAEIGAEYVAYRALMEHWARVLPGRVIEVDHEALVGDPAEHIRWLVTEACGLTWNDACLAFHEAGGAVRTASSVQVRQPIFRTSLQRWRRYEAHLGPLLEALGPYAPSG